MAAQTLSASNQRPAVEALLPTLHPDQQTVVEQAARWNILTCGRRYGKTTLGIRLECEPALDGYPVGWFAPSYKILDDAWRSLRTVLAPVTAHKDESKYRIELIGGGSVECWSLKDNPDAGRSRKYKRVIVDEAAMIPALEAVWTRAIRPTLADYRGDAWFMSTPRGPGYYKALHDRGSDPERPEWMSWQRPTIANPFIDPAEIEDARADMGELVYSQEYLAAFIDLSGAVFRNVRDAAIAEPLEQPEAGHQYVMGVDLARRVDFTVCVVLDVSVQPARMVAMDRFNQIDWLTQVRRIRTLATRFGVQAVIVDQTGLGDPVVEQLQRELAS